MTKWLISFITGANHDLLWSGDPGSKKRYEAYAIAMLFPIGLWAYLGFKISGNQIWVALLALIIVGMFDRAIIMMASNGWLKGIRVVIALAISIIGMIIIDEQIYHQDIEQELTKWKLEEKLNNNEGLYGEIEILKSKQGKL